MYYHLKDLRVPALLGVYESEKKEPQEILVNIFFSFVATKAAQTDDLADTVDYALIQAQVRSICLSEHYQLLEKLHLVLQTQLQQQFPQISNLSIELEKFPFETGSIVLSSKKAREA